MSWKTIRINWSMAGVIGLALGLQGSHAWSQSRAPISAPVQLRGTGMPVPQVPYEKTVSGSDAMLRAGIVTDSRNPNRMVIERVMPNSAAFQAGLRPGDVITAITLGLQVERNGQSRQISVIAGEPATTTAVIRADISQPDRTARGPITPGTSRLDSGVGGSGGEPQGPGTPGLGSAPSEGGGSAAMRTGQDAPVLPGRNLPPRPR